MTQIRAVGPEQSSVRISSAWDSSERLLGSRLKDAWRWGSMLGSGACRSGTAVLDAVTLLYVRRYTDCAPRKSRKIKANRVAKQKTVRNRCKNGASSGPARCQREDAVLAHRRKEQDPGARCPAHRAHEDNEDHGVAAHHHHQAPRRRARREEQDHDARRRIALVGRRPGRARGAPRRATRTRRRKNRACATSFWPSSTIL